MAKVQLEFEIVTTGEGAFLRATQQTEAAMARLKAAASTALVRQDTINSVAGLRTETAGLAHQVTQLSNPYARAAEQLQRHTAAGRQAAISQRDLKQAMGAVAVAMGQASPTLMLAGLELQRFGATLQGLPLAARVGAGGLLALVAAIGYLNSKANDLERVEARLAAVRSAAHRLDAGALRQGVEEAADEQAAIARQREGSLFGEVKYRFSNLFRIVKGQPSTRNEARQRELESTDALAKVMAFESRFSAAEHAARMAQSAVSRRQQLLASLMSSGSAGPETVYMQTRRLIEEIESVKQAEMGSLEMQQTREMRGKRTNAEKDIVRQQYRERKEELLRATEDEIAAVSRLRDNAARRLAAQELEAQTATLRQGSAQRLAILEQQTQIEAGLREARLAEQMAEVQGGELAIARLRAEAERQHLQAGIEATRSASGQRIAEAERMHAALLALLQGQLAQGLLSERDYVAQVRQLDQELFTARQQSLSQYSQALQAALSKAAADYQRYADRVRDLDKQMREAKAGTDDMLAEIKQAGMTPAEAFADRERRAQQKLAEAMTLSGDEQVAALKAVQREYQTLALEAQRASQAQQQSAKTGAEVTKQATTTTFSWGDYQTRPGQYSPAGRTFWAEGGASSAVGGSSQGVSDGLLPWWMRGGGVVQRQLAPWWTRPEETLAQLPWWMRPNAGLPSTSGADPQQLMGKVKELGERIQSSYQAARTQAKGAADESRRIVDYTAATLANLKSSTAATNELAAAFRTAAAAAGELAGARASAGVPVTVAGATAAGGGTWNAPGAEGGTYVVVPRSAADVAEQAIWEEGDMPASEGFHAAAGAVVPGPVGAPVRGTAHGGEVIGPPRADRGGPGRGPAPRRRTRGERWQPDRADHPRRSQRGRVSPRPAPGGFGRRGDPGPRPIASGSM